MPPTGLPATVSFQTTDPATNAVTGTPNMPVNIPGDTLQTFVMTFTPTAAFAPTEFHVVFDCDNTPPAPFISGVNTFQLSGSTTPVPDIIALAATPSGDGIVNIPRPLGTGAFAVASVNVGASAQITVAAEAAISILPPVILSLCQTNQATASVWRSPRPVSRRRLTMVPRRRSRSSCAVKGQCPSIRRTAGSMCCSRIKVEDQGGATRGATGVAVRTQ